MPEISSHLDELLNRWTSRGIALRKEIAFQHDILTSYSLALEAARLSYREARLRDYQTLKEAQGQIDARWQERIYRIEGWQKDIARHKTHQNQLTGAVQTTRWQRKVELSAEPFIRWLNLRATWLKEQQAHFHTDIQQWQSVLEERHLQLTELKLKEDQTSRRILVSRSRRQLELDFIQENRRCLEDLTQRMQKSRRVLNHAFGRLQKAFTVLEHRTAQNTISLDMHKRDLVNSLNPTRNHFHERRDKILADALLFESAKRLFRTVQEMVNGLRCVEDEYKEKPTGWKKILSRQP